MQNVTWIRHEWSFNIEASPKPCIVHCFTVCMWATITLEQFPTAQAAGSRENYLQQNRTRDQKVNGVIDFLHLRFLGLSPIRGKVHMHLVKHDPFLHMNFYCNKGSVPLGPWGKNVWLEWETKRAACILWPLSWEDSMQIKEGLRIYERGNYDKLRGHVKGLRPHILHASFSSSPVFCWDSFSPGFINDLKQHGRIAASH